MMFECSNCVLRCMRAIAGDAFPAANTGTRSMRRFAAAPRLDSRPTRRYASTIPDQEPYLNAKQLRHMGEEATTEALSDSTSRPRHELQANYKALKKELDYLSDPFKLAEHIHYTLRRDMPEKALEIVRIASRDTQCVVSWNHIINWHMQKGKSNEAMKIYNEMKKRAQFPDNYTYMLLLRGLAGNSNHHRTPEAKADNANRAISIYNMMNSPNSRVRPTIMHTNAVLRVCSFSFDLDPFWGVASKIPQHGPLSADHITYTTILTAIRHGAISKHPHDARPAQIEAIRKRAADEGKKVWMDVIAKWRQGEVMIDEELVGSMARVLLISPDIQDWDHVLDLMFQTMKLERVLPSLDSPDRRSEHVPQPTEERRTLTMEAENQEEEQDHTETKATQVFKAVHALPKNPEYPKRPKAIAYLTPGNRTLSCLIDACHLMRAPKAAIAYWDLITGQPTSLKADLPNFHSLLKLLSRNRASGRAAKVLSEDLPTAGIEPQVMTITLAMGACLRDNKNHGVLTHARTIIDVMEARMANLDIHVLESYLNLGLASSTADSNPESAATKLLGVIERFDSLTHNLRSRISFGSDGPTSADWHLRDKERTVGFLQRLVGVIDMMYDKKMVPADKHRYMSARRAQLTKFIGNARGLLIRQGSNMRAHALAAPVENKKNVDENASPVAGSPVRRVVIGGGRGMDPRLSDPSPVSQYAARMDKQSPEMFRFRMKGNNPGRRERAVKKMAKEDDEFVSWGDVSHSETERWR